MMFVYGRSSCALDVSVFFCLFCEYACGTELISNELCINKIWAYMMTFQFKD